MDHLLKTGGYDLVLDNHSAAAEIYGYIRIEPEPEESEEVAAYYAHMLERRQMKHLTLTLALTLVRTLD